MGRLFAHIQSEQKSTTRYRPLRDWTVAALLFGVGLRISEASGLRIADIDLDCKEITVRTSKTHKPRVVAFPETVATVLIQYLAAREAMDVPNDNLFVSRNGTPYTSTTLARSLQRAASNVGIKLTSHSGRRYCITEMARFNVFAAQAQAGHECLETTQMYVQADKRVVHAVMDAHDPLAAADNTRKQGEESSCSPVLGSS